MAFNDYIGGTGWSGHNAPSSQNTNPNNDPAIAASQEQLRQMGSLTMDQMTNGRVVSTYDMSTGDMVTQTQRIAYDTPYGTVYSNRQGQPGENLGSQAPPPTANMNFTTTGKYWWQPGLAEPMVFNFGQDGKISKAQPYDSKYSFGEQLGDAVGSVATLGAVALASYGAAYGLGSTVGTGVGTTAPVTGGVGTANMSAGELAAMDAAGGGMAGTGLSATAPAAAGAGIGAGTAAAGASGGGNFLQRLLGGAGDISDISNLAGTIWGMNQSRENAAESREFYKNAAPNVGYYRDKLKESYENPSAWFEGPEYQAGLNVTHNKLQRDDAAGGRLANDIGREKVLRDYAWSSQNAYRDDLAGIVNNEQNTATGQGASNAMQNAQNSDAEMIRQILTLLNSK